MTKQIQKLVEVINTIECNEEIETLIKGASIALDVDFNTFYRQVQNAFHAQCETVQASEEAVYNCSNVN